MKGFVYGVGRNDSKNQQELKRTPEGKVVRVYTDPIYLRWTGMLRRCYSPSWISRHPSYSGCSVCGDWLTFSNFRDWIASVCGDESVEGYDLDKDLIDPECRHYSPEACVLIPQWLNKMLCRRGNGGLLTGVTLRKGKFTAQIKIGGIKKYLGIFPTEISAHEAWKKEKAKEMIRLTQRYSSDNLCNEKVSQRLQEIISRLESPGVVNWLI